MVGWTSKSIGDVTTIINGGTPKSGVTEYWDGDVLWVTPKDMGKLDCSYVADTSRKISEKGLARSSAKLIPENSVILSTRAPIGHLAINTLPMATNQGCRGLVPSELLDTKYLFYFLRLNVGLLNDLGSGATFKELSKSALAGIQIPLPPLPEQKRIVAILDEAFAGIDAAVANTEKNLANARELFESYLNAVFTQKGDGWVEKTLGEYSVAISTGPFGSLLHKSDYVSEGVPLVNPINIVGRNIVPNSSKLIDEETKKKLQSYVLHEGNIVIARRGEVGRCVVIDSEHDGWVCGTGCFFMQPLPSVNPHFLAHLIRSQGYREKLEKAATGATMKNLSNKTLSNLSVSIPNLEKQTEILANFDALAGETQHLETIYQQKLEDFAELKQSILQKAFTGELTALPEKTLEEAVA